MAICFGYLSALQYWRHNPVDRSRRSGAPGQPSLSHVPTERDLATVDARRLGLTPPFHLCIDHSPDRKAPAGTLMHASSTPLPEGSFSHIEANVLVSNPELCFLQLAHRVLSLPQLVLLGLELCGSYVLRPDIPQGHIRCQPLTTVERLKRFIGRVASLPGVKRARNSLAYLANGSASPAESLLTALLVLPTHAGGYGFEVPALNERIDIPAKAQREANRTHFKCDLYWPRHKTGIEYNGKWHYDDREQRDQDVMRADILADMDEKIIVVTAAQLYDPSLLDTVAHRLARRTGRRLRIRTGNFDQKRLRLHAELTGPNPTL